MTTLELTFHGRRLGYLGPDQELPPLLDDVVRRIAVEHCIRDAIERERRSGEDRRAVVRS